MKTSLLVIILCVCTYHTTGQSRSVSGKILDETTGLPLIGATIKLLDTSTGTVTDAQGFFTLDIFSPISLTLAFSYVGYKTKVLNISNAKDIGNIFLKEQALDLNHVEVESQIDKSWRKDFKNFKRQFFGDSEFGRAIDVNNPWVLDFTHADGFVSATADDILSFTNSKTGYKVDLLFEHYIFDGLNVSYSGKPFFTELEGRYEENRQEAFYGSMRHFFHSLANGISTEEGFSIFLVRKDERNNRYQLIRTLNTKRLITKTDSITLINFPGIIRVNYTKEKSSNGDDQLSFLEAKSETLRISDQGLISPPEFLIEFGHWSQEERVGHWLPNDYFPQEYLNRLKAKKK